MEFEEKIKKAMIALLENDNAHLPLSNRVELMQFINDASITNKIFFECVKFGFDIWEQRLPKNDILPTVLNKVNDYLYNEVQDIDDLNKIISLYKNYFEDIQDEAGLIGLAAISLCISIVCNDIVPVDIEMYKGEDDNYFDYEDWASDFLVAMAFSGGNPFFNKGSIAKRKEFWIWYLSIVKNLYDNPHKPILKWQYKKDIAPLRVAIIPQRTQQYQTTSILGKVNNIIDDILKIYNKYYTTEWDKIVIEAICVSEIDITCYFVRGNSINKMKTSWSIYDIIEEIKDEMYKQDEREGAWLVCKIEFNNDKQYTIEFNYDNKMMLPKELANSPTKFEYEFKNYPRAKEYTPIWWQDILGKRTKYLK